MLSWRRFSLFLEWESARLGGAVSSVLAWGVCAWLVEDGGGRCWGDGVWVVALIVGLGKSVGSKMGLFGIVEGGVISTLVVVGLYVRCGMGLEVRTLLRECWYRIRTLSRELLGVGTLSREHFGVWTLSRELLILVGVINRCAAHCQDGRHVGGLGPLRGG